MARPSKIEPFIEAAKEVLFDDINAIIFTDEELVDEINERLKEEERISHRTFERWKKKNHSDEAVDETGKEFCRLIKKALREQKQNLFTKFRNDKSQWQRWAWIIERKFSDWNLKQISEIDHTTKGEPINKIEVEIVNPED